MHIAMLTSYPLDIKIGSGVVQTTIQYRDALLKLGHESQIFAPETPGKLKDLKEFRESFNEQLRYIDFSSFDVIIGSDFDGYLLPENNRPPFFAINGGILADIVRFESGESAKTLKYLAGLEKQNVSKARKIIVPSHYTAQMVNKYYDIDLNRIAVVMPGINYTYWQEQLNKEHKIDTRQIRILCVARHYPRKGIADLIYAMNILRQKNLPIYLDLVGCGPELRTNQKLIAELGLNKIIDVHGDIGNRDRMINFYRNADIFCLPSHHETFGLVFLEAMASALPVVTYDSTAIPEVVPDNCGILCETCNIEELAGALEKLINDSQLRTKLAGNGLKLASQMTWEGSASRLIEVLQGITGE